MQTRQTSGKPLSSERTPLGGGPESGKRGRGSPLPESTEEAQLLREGRQLLGRAVGLFTRTPKIKVWVPLLCSFVLTGYYLYTLHKKAAADLPRPPAEPSAVVVAETATLPQSPATAGQPAQSQATGSNADESCVEIRKRAEQAHAAQQFDDEAKLWQQFMERSPLPQEACPEIGKAYERAGEIDASIQAYEQCVSFEPGNADILVAFAHALQTKQDFTRAASLYRRVLLKDPKNFDAQTGLALIDLKQDRLEEADEDVTNILRKAPDNTDALLIAGIVAWRQARLPDAERIFLKGAGLDDQRPDFHAFLGRIAEAQGRPQDALRQYERALALDPNDSDIAEHRDRLQAKASTN